MSETETAMDCAPDKRQLEAAAWAAKCLNMDKVELQAVSGDASFRRYFRFDTENRTLVLMDAPPDKEDSAPFIDIDRRLRSAGLNAPEILHFDLDLGFGLLEDFGDTLYRDILDQKSVDELFPPLFEALKKMASEVDVAGLPVYDALALQQEMALFPERVAVVRPDHDNRVAGIWACLKCVQHPADVVVGP